MSTQADASRLARLARVFEQICSGKTPLTVSNYGHFLEAIYSSPDPPACVSRLLGYDQTGLEALQKSLRFDASPKFLNGHATKLCLFLSAPDVADIHGGKYVQNILVRALSPPIFFNALLSAFRQRELTPEADAAVGWLLLQIVTKLPDDTPDYEDLRRVSEDEWILEQLLKSSSNEARTLAYKLQQALTTPEAGVANTAEEQPGGRHDNDHAEIRSIAIMPTANELLSTAAPFLRTASYLSDPEAAASRTVSHIDNQFRLLREDILGEVREEMKIALGEKKGRHRGLVLRVQFGGILVPDTSRGLVGIMLECPDGIGLPKNLGDETQKKRGDPKDPKNMPKISNGAKKREEYLKTNRNIIKHQSLSCLVVDNRVITFLLVHRDEHLLAQTLPVIVTLTDTTSSMARALVALKTGASAKLIQVDSSVFAYEPVLVALQELKSTDLKLAAELLHWVPTDKMPEPPSLSTTRPLVERFKANRHLDLGIEFSLGKQIVLDVSQANSFLSGLTQAVSLIQGPPGT